MTQKINLLVLISIMLAAPTALFAQDEDQNAVASLPPQVAQAVEAAFPQNLRFAPAPPTGEGAPLDPYHSCATVFSQESDGTPNLLAAGYSGQFSQVAMLDYQQGKAGILSVSPFLEKGLAPKGCEISIVNLADPAKPDSPLARAIETSFSGGPSWFLLWEGGELHNITALEPDSALPEFRIPSNSAMFSVDVVDFDHSGAMQIVGLHSDADESPQDEDGIAATGTRELFRFNGTAFIPVKSFLACKKFEPNMPKTVEQKDSYSENGHRWMMYIAMHKPPAPHYKLTIINGDRVGSNRVSSAKIELNGVTVLDASEINLSVETLVRNIHLQKQNKIKATVDGPAGSHLYVVVE